MHLRNLTVGSLTSKKVKFSKYDSYFTNRNFYLQFSMHWPDKTLVVFRYNSKQLLSSNPHILVLSQRVLIIWRRNFKILAHPVFKM